MIRKLKFQHLNLADDLISYLFIFLFCYTGVSKLIQYKKFVIEVGLSPLLPAFAKEIVFLIPVIEILTALFLLFPKTRRVGLLATITLMLLFTLYVLGVLTLAPEVPCSCGGVIESMGWTGHLLFNTTLLLISLSGLFIQRSTMNHPL